MGGFMYNKFTYVGGVKNSLHSDVEKLMAFVVIGGEEVPLYQVVREGLVTQIDNSTYQMYYDTMKLFLSSVSYRFGTSRRLFHGFYIKFQKEEDSPIVTVKAFDQEVAPDFMFKGQFRFLKKKEVLSFLTNDKSKKFLRLQMPLPKKKLKQTITVCKANPDTSVRAIKINKKRKEQKNELLDSY